MLSHHYVPIGLTEGPAFTLLPELARPQLSCRSRLKRSSRQRGDLVVLIPLFSLPLRPWEPGRTVDFLIHDDLQPEHVDVQLVLDLPMQGRTIAWVRPADSLLQQSSAARGSAGLPAVLLALCPQA